MNTPIFDLLVHDVPEVCGSRGPRIGEDGQPRCAKPLGHSDNHSGFEGSGFENVWWGARLMRDAEFAADWRLYLIQQRAKLFAGTL